MTDDAAKQTTHALGLIQQAFADRKPPSEMTDSLQLSDTEYDEVMAFRGLAWQDVNFDLVRRCADAVFWFAPEAFRYYLPGIMAAGLRESRTDTNAYDALIGMLDRSSEPDWWDDFFLPRWPPLTTDEIAAVREWVRWLALIEPAMFRQNTLERVLDTLLLLQWAAEER